MIFRLTLQYDDGRVETGSYNLRGELLRIGDTLEHFETRWRVVDLKEHLNADGELQEVEYVCLPSV
jgi:hypothetical protein